MHAQGVATTYACRRPFSSVSRNAFLSPHPVVLIIFVPLNPKPFVYLCSQVGLIKAGKPEEIVQETRLWDEFKLQTISMRKKVRFHRTCVGL